MAVSLVSTGVQFPDSTIQTTAASASPATLVASYNFSGQTSFSLTLDFTTYPGGYQFIWCDVYPSSSGGALLAEWSGNSGSSWSAFSSQGSSATLGTTTWSGNSNISGYVGYTGGGWYASAVGFSMNMWLSAKNQPSGSFTSAITLNYQGVASAADPRNIYGYNYYYTYGAQAFTNVRFTPTAGNFASGSLRILGYK